MDSVRIPASADLRSIEVNGQMDPDTLAELLRPWRGNGRTRGPAFEIVLRGGRMIVPEPLLEMDAQAEATLKRGDVIYVISIEGGRSGVGVRMNISFSGEAALIDQLDDRWMEPNERMDNQSYAGFRFRGDARRLISSEPTLAEFIPVLITMTRASESDAKSAAVMSGEEQTTPENSGGC